MATTLRSSAMVKSPALLASLFGHLATDFAALIGRGVDIEIPLAGIALEKLAKKDRRTLRAAEDLGKTN